MAAYEVLLLNTAIPQIQAAQSGDTYVVPRDIAINATAIISANSATDALRITQTGAGNAILVEDSANPDSTPFVVTAVGDVGIGTSLPSTKLDVVGAIKATAAGASLIAVEGGAQNFALIQMQATSSGGKNWSLVSNATSSPLGAAGSLSFRDSSAGVTYMTLDSSGRLLVGVTSNTGGANLEVISNGVSAFTARSTSSGASTTVKAVRSVSSDAADFANAQYDALSHGWILSNGSQAMTLDASGNLGVGSTTINVGSYGRVITVAATAAAYGAVEISGTTGGAIDFQTSQSTRQVQLLGNSNGFVMLTNGGAGLTERARITSGGYFKASNTGTYDNSTGAFHEFNQSSGGEWTLYSKNTAASNSYGLAVFYSASAPNGTGNQFLYLVDSAQLRAEIRSNGGLANFQANDVNLSDMRAKKDVVPAPSYWDKIKGIEIVHFKYKDQTHDDNNVGVIAQQVEQVAPEFVDQDGWGETPEDGVPLKSIYTSDMYHAAIKALQEAMARIETLEAEVAALKGA